MAQPPVATVKRRIRPHSDSVLPRACSAAAQLTKPVALPPQIRLAGTLARALEVVNEPDRTPPGARPRATVNVLIVGPTNLPSTAAFHASLMYAKTVMNFLLHLAGGGKLNLDFTDELTRGPLLTHQGEVAHEAGKAVLAGSQGRS